MHIPLLSKMLGHRTTPSEVILTVAVTAVHTALGKTEFEYCYSCVDLIHVCHHFSVSLCL